VSGLSRRDLFARLAGRAPRTGEPIALSVHTCLAWNGTLCFSCKEVCEAEAITFFGMRRPVIDSGACTLCGACVPLCPTGAITLKGE
jgi:ferredoxin-type protein NapF